MLTIIGLAIFFLGILFVSIAITNAIVGEKEEQKKIKKHLLLAIFFFLVAVIILKEDVENRTIAQEIKETNATYYEVTNNMKKEVEKNCVKNHPKYSTQQNCISGALSDLKYGNDFKHVKASNIVTKPSGVKP